MDADQASYLSVLYAGLSSQNNGSSETEGGWKSEPEGKVWVKTRRSNSWRELADRTYDVKPATGGHGGADPVICRDFVAMCLDGKAPEATPLAGRMSVATGIAGAVSMRSGGQPQDVATVPDDLTDWLRAY